MERRTRTGRNDACPCGSGRKYKKCHLAAEEAAERARDAGAAAFERLTRELVPQIVDFAFFRFGDDWDEQLFDDFAPDRCVVQLAAPWLVHHVDVGGAPVAAQYVEARGPALSAEQRSWMHAQREAWLSIWDVPHVEPGRRAALRDRLTHETREIFDRMLSRTLRKGDCVLARIVDFEGQALVGGMHPHPLPPPRAAEVERRARGRLRCKGAVPPERLRNEATGRYLIRRWEEEIEDWAESTELLELCNACGAGDDPILFTTDHFTFDPSRRGDVAALLASLEGARAPGEDEDPDAYVFFVPGGPLHPDGGHPIGAAQLSPGRLRVDAISRERADALRRRIEQAGAGLLRHHAREYVDPLSDARGGPCV